ncbi:hypothetical protein [Streptomyces sp. NPDC004284]|uniref:hypothetical protein n=1 Tax=Streptomyces sp. NPDC004284 TaxID=3364695 RepID=UPI0036844200
MQGLQYRIEVHQSPYAEILVPHRQIDTLIEYGRGCGVLALSQNSRRSQKPIPPRRVDAPCLLGRSRGYGTLDEP